MALDKWIAIVFLLISIVYGYASYTYPLLPFERNMSFLPNTMPMVLAVFGALFALMIIFSPSPRPDDEGDALVLDARIAVFDGIMESETILKSGTPAAGDEDAQHQFRIVFFLDQLCDFLRRGICEDDRHGR